MNKIIAMVGMAGSGKTVISEYLQSIGWKSMYFGGITYERMSNEGIENTKANETKMRERIREEYGMGAYAILSMPKIKEAIKDSNVVIDDLYSWAEYEVLEKEFGENVILLCNCVDKKIRYERLKNRKERSYTEEEARERDLRELEKLDKGRPIAFADYYIFNNGSKEEQLNRLKEILKQI